jgi:predicted ABC-type ATPase
VKRRYKRGLDNFFKIFQPLCDYWEILDNSGDLPDSIAAGEKKSKNQFIMPNFGVR